jgi:hypothetical protein
MKNTTNTIKYSNLYDAILSRNIHITFGQFLELHNLRILDISKVKFVIREFDKNSFGHFEVEQSTPSYNYNAFFGHTYAE